MTYSDRIAKDSAQCFRTITEALMEAAKAENIRLDEGSISVGIGRGGEITVNSAVEGLARVNPLDYEQGVVTNFVYSNFGGRNIPKGFSVVTTYSDWVRRGPIHTRLHFSQGSNRVAVMPGRGIVTALTVPEDRTPFVRTGVRIGTAFPGELEDWEEVDFDSDPPTITYYTECSNGQYSCSEPEPYYD